MVQIAKQVAINFADTEDEDILAWVKGERLNPDQLDDLVFTHTFRLSADTLAESEIDALFREEVSLGSFGWLPRIYRLLAEGDARAAMDELHREFPQLRPPQAELALVTRLGGGLGRG
jgi:hypothetical protein